MISASPAPVPCVSGSSQAPLRPFERLTSLLDLTRSGLPQVHFENSAVDGCAFLRRIDQNRQP